MPLTAKVDGELLRASLLSDSDWSAIHVPARRRRVVILCPGCEFPMHPKERSALRFYAHNPGEHRPGCIYAIESLAHLGLKDAVATAAEKAGATVELERAFDGGRVDVLADMGAQGAWAFEAQLAPLGLQDAVERDRRYRTEFGHSSWLHTRQSPWRRYVPALRIEPVQTTIAEETDELFVVIDGVYEDTEGEIPCPSHPVTAAVGCILPDSRGRRRYDWLFQSRSDDSGSFGYYVDWDKVRDVDAAQRAVRRRARSRNKGEGHVSDVCAKTGQDLSLLEVDEPPQVPVLPQSLREAREVRDQGGSLAGRLRMAEARAIGNPDALDAEDRRLLRRKETR